MNYENTPVSLHEQQAPSFLTEIDDFERPKSEIGNFLYLYLNALIRLLVIFWHLLAKGVNFCQFFPSFPKFK